MPAYITDKLFGILAMEIQFFRVQQELKNDLILHHGELAERTFKLIAGEDDLITFEEL